MTAPVNRRDGRRAAARLGGVSVTQQYVLATYRARRLGEVLPPRPIR
ncbi:hypothetical protein [Streptomyces hokutonensis]|uniref:Uncharacterized protein n=1 Tax=Streptomyces hokutonensis TaxID=1306990 RepID=A0ABW6MKI2_9ACTN